MKTILATMFIFTASLYAGEAEAEKTLKTRVADMARMVSMDGWHVRKSGVMGTMTLKKPVAKETPGNKFKVTYVMVPAGKAEGVLTGAKDVKAGTMSQTFPNGVPSINRTYISWTGKAWPIGSIQYTQQDGLLRTCALWTADETEALDFYRKLGFTKAAEDAVRVER